MSAICGVAYLKERPVARAEPARMMKALAHRGPDAQSLWCDEHAALGHLLLRTTPEAEHERYPLVLRHGAIALTVAGRLDNREQLAATLGVARDATDIPITDARLFGAAYERWGDNCARELVGDFALAVWDAERRTLFCARDAFGVRPLYYFTNGDVIAVATEIKSLLALAGVVPRRLDETRVADYLASLCDDTERTFYAGIRRLPPGHILTAGRDGVRLRRYWAPDQVRELKLRDDAEYAEGLRACFIEAVRCRMRTEQPVGVLLSGGLDSSSVACVANKLRAGADPGPRSGDGRLHTISSIFEGLPPCDEREYIREVLAHGDFEPHFVRADLLSPLGEVDRMLDAGDEPFYAPNWFMRWANFRTAAAHGVRVTLDGTDGDNVVSHGLPLLSELARRGRFGAFHRELTALARRGRRSRRALLHEYGLRALVPEPLRSCWRAVRGISGPPCDNPTIRATFATRFGLLERVAAENGPLTRPSLSERAWHCRNLTAGVHALVFELFDKASGQFGFENRHPFFDRRVVEYCVSLPAAQKLRDGWNRWVMREAMDGILPPAIQWREGKQNLASNFLTGLATVDRVLVEDVVLRDPSCIAPYVEVSALRHTYDEFARTRTMRDAWTIWKAVTLGLWLRRASVTP